jgi:hypothetical protein
MCISHHEKDNPREGGRVIQKMSDNRRKQTVTPQEIRYAPHRPEKRSGQHDAIRGNKRRLFRIERTASERAKIHPGQVPTRQTPKSLKETPRFLSRNQAPMTNSHSAITPARNQKKKRCSGEPQTAAGMEPMMNLEKTQISVERTPSS